jgi:drug/metabolite transporter (DMT)-like permease
LISGLGWSAIAALLFALMSFFGRVAGATVPWTTVVASRAAVGALVALAVAWARGAPMIVRDRRGIWLRTLFGTLSMLCSFYALASPSLPLGDTATLLNLTPVFVAALGPIVLGERAGRAVGMALAIALTGVVLISRPSVLFGGLATQPGALFSALVAVSGAVCAACAMLALRKIGPHEGPEAIALHFSATATVALTVLAIPRLSMPPLGGALATVGAGLAAAFAQLAVTRAYALERAAPVSAMGYLTVVASAALGAVALGEWPSTLTLTGMMMIVAAGLVVAYQGPRKT